MITQTATASTSPITPAMREAARRLTINGHR